MKAGMRELVMALLLLAVPVVSYFLVFKPQNEEILGAREEISMKRDLLERLRAETARNDDLERANLAIGTRLEQIEARLPSGKQVDTVIRQISELAIDAGLEPPAMTSDKPVSAAYYREQPLEIETSGEFEGFYQFLQSLERLPRVTRVPNMELKRDSRNDGELDVKFTLSIYFQDEAAAKKSEAKSEEAKS